MSYDNGKGKDVIMLSFSSGIRISRVSEITDYLFAIPLIADYNGE